jgi:hypothetical protein
MPEMEKNFDKALTSGNASPVDIKRLLVRGFKIQGIADSIIGQITDPQKKAGEIAEFIKALAKIYSKDSFDSRVHSARNVLLTWLNDPRTSNITNEVLGSIAFNGLISLS